MSEKVSKNDTTEAINTILDSSETYLNDKPEWARETY